MSFMTYGDIRNKILRDLDLEDEIFITADELLGYVNEAIDEAEAEIHTLYEDYFLARATLTLVSGQEAYALPANMYAHKIRRILYRNGTETRAIPRLRDWKKFEVYTQALANATGTAYEYFIDNTTSGAPKIILSPTPTEDGPYVTIWYLRNAAALAVEADVCDIPEFVQFVIQYAKVRCYEKEGHPNLGGAVQYLERQRQLMNATLSSMVADGSTEIEPDMTFYRDHE
jgi:hypothetical protein